MGDLRSAGVRQLICLVSDQELEWAGVSVLGRECEMRGIRFRKHPIMDQGIPSLDEARVIVDGINEALDAGERVVLHCMGGLGRTGTMAACLLSAHGLDPDASLTAVRRTRGPRAVEVAEQANFVRDYASAALSGWQRQWSD